MLLICGFQKALIFPDVIRLVIRVRGQHHADGALAEAVHLAPNQTVYQHALARVSQPELRCLDAVVNFEPETARQGEHDLLQDLVGMPATLGIHRDVVEVIDPCDVEWHVVAAFDEGQISARIGYDRQVDQARAAARSGAVRGHDEISGVQLFAKRRAQGVEAFAGEFEIEAKPKLNHLGIRLATRSRCDRDIHDETVAAKGIQVFLYP